MTLDFHQDYLQLLRSFVTQIHHHVVVVDPLNCTACPLRNEDKFFCRPSMTLCNRLNSAWTLAGTIIRSFSWSAVNSFTPRTPPAPAGLPQPFSSAACITTWRALDTFLLSTSVQCALALLGDGAFLRLHLGLLEVRPACFDAFTSDFFPLPGWPASTGRASRRAWSCTTSQTAAADRAESCATLGDRPPTQTCE